MHTVTRGESVQQTSDSGYIVIGWTQAWGSNGPDIYLAKTNSTGDTLWTRTYGGPRGGGQAYSVQQTSDGGYIIAGCTSSFPLDHVYLIKTNASGDTLWTRAYGGPDTGGRGYSVQQTTDGGYVVAGYASPSGGGTSRVYLIKTDAHGLVTSVPEESNILPVEYALQQNYPNPFNPSTTIQYAVPHRSHMTLIVFNVLGQQAARLVSGEIEAGYHSVQFYGSNLASGVYFYRLTAGSFVGTKKLLLVK